MDDIIFYVFPSHCSLFDVLAFYILPKQGMHSSVVFCALGFAFPS
jgi:hypothetical protein